MNIYNQLVALAKKAQEETANSKHPLFSSYQNDLFTWDKDVCFHEMQKGDHYIWTLKQNGCGTRLTLLDGKVDNVFKKEMLEPNCINYHITVTGDNEGTVLEITGKKAADLTDANMLSTGRVPKRTSLYEHLTKLFDLENSGHRLSDLKLWSDFNPNPKDKTLIKLTAQDRFMHITLLRTKVNMDEDGELPSKLKGEYFTPRTLKMIQSMSVGESKYLLIETTQKAYATIKEVSKRVFDNALHKHENKSIELDKSSEMSL